MRFDEVHAAIATAVPVAEASGRRDSECEQPAVPAPPQPAAECAAAVLTGRLVSMFLMEDAEQGVKGWVRLAAKDGHDVIDTRDQLEFEKEIQRLRLTRPKVLNAQFSVIPETEASNKSGSEDNNEGETSPEQKRNPGACSNTTSSEGSSHVSSNNHHHNNHEKPQSKEKAPLPNIADAFLASKGPLQEVESDEECKDERQINENSSLEDRSYKSCCTCNTRSA